MRVRFLPLALLLPSALLAQEPIHTYAGAVEARATRAQPVVEYTVEIQPKSAALAVEMRVRNAPAELRLAMPRWAPGAYRLVEFGRRVRDLSVTTGGRTTTLGAPSPDGYWPADPRARIAVSGGEATIRYVVPSDTAPNNRAFVRPDGALVDGPATFLYMVGQKLVPARVRLELPAAWRVVTGLEPTADPRRFFAPSYDVLIDSPVLTAPAGNLGVRLFTVDEVPHRVAWWGRTGGVAFDTTAFVDATRRIVDAARQVFGRLPYREYAFLFVDGTGGGLEHLNSTSIGGSAAALARDPRARAQTTAHEFFHAWNIKRIRPSVLGPFDYQKPVRTTDLWFSEGVTDFYGSALVRRAGLLTESEAREQLAGDIEAYLANPAREWLSPERSSWTAWDPSWVNQGASGGFYYLQGALLGELLDQRIGQATGGARALDDVMRAMLDRFAGARGFAGEDALHVVNDVCACDLAPLFFAHVSGAVPVPVDSIAEGLGWRLVVRRAPAVDAAGRALPDLRVGGVPRGGVGSAGGATGEPVRLSLGDPTSAWGRAGLAGGDIVLEVNGRPVREPADVRSAIAGARIGDTVRVAYLREGERRTALVPVGGYERVSVTLEELPQPTAEQRRARAAWMGKRD